MFKRTSRENFGPILHRANEQASNISIDSENEILPMPPVAINEENATQHKQLEITYADERVLPTAATTGLTNPEHVILNDETENGPQAAKDFAYQQFLLEKRKEMESGQNVPYSDLVLAFEAFQMNISPAEQAAAEQKIDQIVKDLTEVKERKGEQKMLKNLLAIIYSDAQYNYYQNSLTVTLTHKKPEYNCQVPPKLIAAILERLGYDPATELAEQRYTDHVISLLKINGQWHCMEGDTPSLLGDTTGTVITSVAAQKRLMVGLPALETERELMENSTTNYFYEDPQKSQPHLWPWLAAGLSHLKTTAINLNRKFGSLIGKNMEMTALPTTGAATRESTPFSYVIAYLATYSPITRKQAMLLPPVLAALGFSYCGERVSEKEISTPAEFAQVLHEDIAKTGMIVAATAEKAMDILDQTLTAAVYAGNEEKINKGPTTWSGNNEAKASLISESQTAEPATLYTVSQEELARAEELGRKTYSVVDFVSETPTTKKFSENGKIIYAPMSLMSNTVNNNEHAYNFPNVPDDQLEFVSAAFWRYVIKDLYESDVQDNNKEPITYTINLQGKNLKVAAEEIRKEHVKYLLDHGDDNPLATSNDNKINIKINGRKIITLAAFPDYDLAYAQADETVAIDRNRIFIAQYDLTNYRKLSEPGLNFLKKRINYVFAHNAKACPLVIIRSDQEIPQSLTPADLSIDLLIKKQTAIEMSYPGDIAYLNIKIQDGNAGNIKIPRDTNIERLVYHTDGNNQTQSVEFMDRSFTSAARDLEITADDNMTLSFSKNAFAGAAFDKVSLSFSNILTPLPNFGENPLAEVDVRIDKMPEKMPAGLFVDTYLPGDKLSIAASAITYDFFHRNNPRMEGFDTDTVEFARFSNTDLVSLRATNIERSALAGLNIKNLKIIGVATIQDNAFTSSYVESLIINDFSDLEMTIAPNAFEGATIGHINYSGKNPQKTKQYFAEHLPNTSFTEINLNNDDDFPAMPKPGTTARAY